MNRATRIAFLASAFLALGALGAAAQTGTTAYTAPVTRSAKVSLADLDLATEEGQSAARERAMELIAFMDLDRAARDVKFPDKGAASLGVLFFVPLKSAVLTAKPFALALWMACQA